MDNINIKQIIAVVLSFINLIFSILAFFILAEYFEIITEGLTWRFEFREVWTDVLLMIVGIAMFIVSLMSILRYFRHQEIKLKYSIFFLIVYFLLSLFCLFQYIYSDRYYK
ncbi:MAG: hypothetical protein Q8P20_08400 [bacterium]|nr:hypothetical protein [bacterium]